MILSSPIAYLSEGVFVELDEFVGPAKAFLKLESFNVAGSIKLKPAIHMLDELQTAGRLHRGARLIESSSGNLGVALAMVCRARKFDFTCVSDPNLTSHAAAMMRTLGAKVVVVTDRDANGGFLQTRIDYIQRELAADPSLIWLNQYANPSNLRAHARSTALEILRDFPRVDYLFVGTGTCGTAMGCSEVFRERSPSTRIVAIDVEGSVTFGGRPGPRKIPGLGTSRRPEIADPRKVDEVLIISERETIAMCRELVGRYGILLGGSSGTVLTGLRKRLVRPAAGEIAIAIAPDSGERYLDSIYDDEWVVRHFPQPPSLT
ncbi:2,3-diaminopropionate biosynthesis protein SbnA [Bradyrhizobium sp. ARR65]|uniref:2,3-diaminopropionate biosynthesis protein SbnA n=1 Tax=Bradyrhizobium sp. ARR65 TaxID=1040989 RepID=UPI000465B091|nr:2,3-diaminopropionate biosynthesis protein SbnA [Bradyrhizobium sp. ARR65]